MQLTNPFYKEQNPFRYTLSATARFGDRQATVMPRKDIVEPTFDLLSWSHAKRVSALEQDLLAKEARIDALQQQLTLAQYRNHEESQFAPLVTQLVGRITQISERLFPGPVNIEYAFDPEDPSVEWLIFDVVAQGEYKDYRDRIFQWHDEVDTIVPGTAADFRLSVMPQR